MIYPQLNALSDTLSLEGEVWKDIKGYEGIYQVSNIGRVKRLARVSTGRNQVCSFPIFFEEIVMKINNDSKGYPQVILTYPIKRNARVHRLVAETFLEAPSEELRQECEDGGLDYVLVNHLDEDICNPNVENLEWCSVAYNNTFGKSRKGNPKVSGSASVNAILKEADVIEIVRLVKAGGLSQEKIADRFGVKQITISNIWTGRSWSHLTGFKHTPRVKMYSERDAMRISEQNIISH